MFVHSLGLNPPIASCRGTEAGPLARFPLPPWWTRALMSRLDSGPGSWKWSDWHRRLLQLNIAALPTWSSSLCLAPTFTGSAGITSTSPANRTTRTSHRNIWSGFQTIVYFLMSRRFSSRSVLKSNKTTKIQINLFYVAKNCLTFCDNVNRCVFVATCTTGTTKSLLLTTNAKPKKTPLSCSQTFTKT